MRIAATTSVTSAQERLGYWRTGGTSIASAIAGSNCAGMRDGAGTGGARPVTRLHVGRVQVQIVALYIALEIDLHQLELPSAGATLPEPRAVDRSAHSIEQPEQLIFLYRGAGRWRAGPATATGESSVLIDGSRSVVALKPMGRGATQVRSGGVSC